ncbi:MAG: PQQ-dependent sugar dehydrogenase [Gammaproteobacteria bacterium]|nr:PQQ-dependent sugar dehydrogenase [Gammaproteobacteria bacterium]
MLKTLIIAASILVSSAAVAEDTELPFKVTPVATFNEPWAMTFMPDGKMLVTEKRGRLYIVTQDGEVGPYFDEVPNVDYRGQGGLGDVIVHPEFEKNQLVYLSYAESGMGNTRGAAVARGRIQVPDRGRPYLTDVEVIWRQIPKMTDDGHYGHRMAFDKDGYLFISSGDRQKFDPAQHMTGTVGKIVRLHDDGSVPDDNPFAEDGDITEQIWSIGHRNPLGLAFDAKGRLWNTEMGPLHGDELNLVKAGKNYGYPIVSNGDHYSGEPIPDHDTRPEFEAPKVSWTPTIAPAELIFYSGNMFPELKGSALIAGLASRAIIRVEVDGESAREVERFKFDNRIREIEQGPDGSLWVLEDKDGGRLLQLTRK